MAIEPGELSVTTSEVSQDLRPTVLVVDDDEGVRLVTRASLETHGFRVIEAECGRDALSIFNGHGVDVVLLDIMMPDMDGFAVCSALRAKPEGKHTAIVMMTGLDDAESIRFAYHLGATDFITKPLNHVLLEYRLHYLLRAKGTADALRKVQGKMNNAQRIARLAYWEWDSATNKLICSDTFRTLFGLPTTISPEDVCEYLGRVHAEDRSETLRTLERACTEGTRYRIEHRVVQPDESVRTVYQEGEFQRRSDGSLGYAAGTIHDVTDRRSLDHTSETARVET